MDISLVQCCPTEKIRQKFGDKSIIVATFVIKDNFYIELRLEKFFQFWASQLIYTI